MSKPKHPPIKPASAKKKKRPRKQPPSGVAGWDFKVIISEPDASSAERWAQRVDVWVAWLMSQWREEMSKDVHHEDSD